jgi:hypothetical protein
VNILSIVIVITLVIASSLAYSQKKDSQKISPNNDAVELTIKQIDGFLKHWDNFAKGNEDSEYLIVNTQSFYDNINKLLDENNQKVVPRVVFYFFVQAFYFLEEDTRLYSSLHRISGGKLIAVEVKEKGKLLDSSLIWKWWKTSSQNYPKYPLLENWINSTFAKETVIPMYERLSKN